MTTLLVALVSSAAVFHVADEWVVVNSNGDVQARFKQIAGLTPEAVVALEPNRFVVTANPRDGDHPALWIVEATGTARRIAHPRGAHLFPSVTADGAWVYFSYHPDPLLMGRGPDRPYTQIWRVRPDGSELQQLTESAGCKLSPTVNGTDVYFAHARCGEHRQGLGRVGEDGAEVDVLKPSDDYPIEPVISPNGELLAFGWLTARTIEVRVSRRASPGQSKTVWSGSRYGNALGLRWLNSKELMFVHIGELKKVSASSAKGKAR